MDMGAHFHRCDLQVHTPRDLRWTGPNAVTDEERLAYGRRLVAACRGIGLQAIAITDHHCMAFLPFIRRAADEETAEDGTPLGPGDKLTVFPGMELTLGVPCQAIVVFDADFPNDMFPLVTAALAITQNDPADAKVRDVVRLGAVTTFSELKSKLDAHEYLRGRYIVLPNVTGEGEHSLLRAGQADKYIEMPCVGGYCDGRYADLREGTRNRLECRDRARSERDPWRHNLYRVPDFTSAERRRHRILHALFRALEREGAAVAEDERGELVATLDGEKIPFALREKLKQVMRPLTTDEKRWGLSNKDGARQELEPTGQLEFSIRAWTDQPLRKTWLETEKKPLESVLPEIVATFLVLGPLLAERSRRREEEARIYAERQRLAELERQKRQQDDNRWARFVELAAAWRQARLAREFIAELRKLDGASGAEIDGRSLGDWLDWAEARADAADPLRRETADVFGEIGEVTARSYPPGPDSNRRFT